MKFATRSLLAFLLAAALLVGALPLRSIPSERDVPESRRSEIVAPGVEHVEIRRGVFSPDRESDRWVINVLLLDPLRVQLVSALAMDEIVGAETTSSIAVRYGALAAINGGYFQTTGVGRGEPTGIYVLGENVLSEPSRPRTELAISNAGGTARLAIAQVSAVLEIVVGDGERRSVDGINRARGRDELILFTPEFHRTTLTPPGGTEVTVRNGRITQAGDGTGSRPIPSDGFILSADGEAQTWVRARLFPGAPVALEKRLIAVPPLPYPAEAIIGGGPHLAKDGKSLGPAEADAEGFSGPEFTFKRHPRTAAGTRRDGTVVLVTVDGRQPKTSVGMTVEELAGLMLELGCADAINLDGGGSTTMVVRGRVVNAPSDAAGERPVGDALLVLGRK